MQHEDENSHSSQPLSPWTCAALEDLYAAGAVQFLFQLPDGRKYIHCGDMRFGEHLMGNEHLQRFVGADGVFLDTTYCKAKHQFPPQVLNWLSCNLLQPVATRALQASSCLPLVCRGQFSGSQWPA